MDAGERTGLEVAVVGLAGRFPGADDVQSFWRNLREGVDAITRLTRQELLDAGVDPALVDHPDFVPARGELRGADELDAGLFGMTPRDAEVLNPQHRLLLECAWAALENAGYDPARAERPVGVFAGCGTNTYVLNLAQTPELVRSVGMTRIALGNEKDHLSAGVSYRLNLRGPALAVQTACSTSLVAVHLACQSLINGECDMALAGGVTVQLPLRGGYLYAPDGILSPDGRCRAFDAEARGSVGGSGAGLVVLKRLDDALDDGDTVLAVIRGSAINNDGAQKVGYTAPSVTGQARVISEALSVAGVDPATVQYVETHGTGTPLGDAIELKAMCQALSRGNGAGKRTAIGSVKTNVGHLDAAAGVTGLIKTVLALRHREIPPTLHFSAPNPEIEAAGNRVFVNAELRPWERDGAPRRAGVSSFGLGGTNAHAIVEEAPAAEPSGPSRELQLFVLSARTPTALAASAANLAAFLEGDGAPPLADAAYTLQVGRREMEHRLAIVAAGAGEAAERLRDAAGKANPPAGRDGRPVAFMFPGLGMQYVDMGRGLYDAEPAYRDAVDECCELLRPVLGSDLRDVLFASSSGETGGGWDLRAMLGRGGASSPLDDTRLAQPAVFVTGYALARLWMSWGVTPRALVGHSLGEYVAACVAGVLKLEDALHLVALRARLLDALPAGAMLAVPMAEDALRSILPDTLDIAAVNTAESCVVSGPVADVEAFEAALAEREMVSRRLATRHAFHSRAMEPVAGELERLLAGFELGAPQIPFVSNVTGTWISDDDARSAAYWARHLCRTVRFADCVATLRAEPGWALLETGPGQTLGAWAMQHPGHDAAATAVFSSLRHQHNRVPDLRFVLETLGGLWTAGVEVDWKAFGGGERRRRVPLPGYPFERRRYWVDPPRRAVAVKEAAAPVAAADNGGPAAHVSHEKEAAVMENRIAAAGTAPSPRYEAILDRLKGLAAELTGIDAELVQTDVHFFQAGIDSLLLLQAIQAVEKRLGVRLSLIEMLEEMTTLDAVAMHIDRVLPAEAVLNGNGSKNGKHAEAAVAMAEPPAAASAPSAAPSAPAAPPVVTTLVAAPPQQPPTAPQPAAAPAAAAQPPVVAAPPVMYPPAVGQMGAAAPGADAMLERVINQQLQLMAQQLAAIRGAPAAPVAQETIPAAPAPVAQAVAPVAAAAPVVAEAVAAVETTAVAPAAPAEAPSRTPIRPETPYVAYQPISTEGPNTLSAQQKEYLDAFIERYVARTGKSKEHQAKYHLPLADTRVTARFRRAWKELSYPIANQRAAGSRIWDLDGNEYVDIGMGYGCNLFGHAPDFVSRAIREQVEVGYGLGPQSPLAGRAAELVCEIGGVERAVFCNSGTEAVMGAIRAARTYTGRTKVAYFAGSYHGWSDIVQGRLVTAGGRREARPTAPGISQMPLQDVILLDWDNPGTFDLIAQHRDEIAVVVVEPVQSRRPDLHPREFLQELRRVTREAGILLHFDELITGFRILPGGAQAYFGVDADLVTYGKIVAGGLPMGVVAGKRDVMAVFDGGLWNYGDDSYPPAQRTLFAGAFFKHPISMGVTCAIMEEIRARGVPMYEALNARSTALVERMNAFFEAGAFPITAVNFGSVFRFFFGPEVRFPDLFNYHLIHEGVYTIPETGTGFLSPVHTDADLDFVYRAVCAAAEALRRGGFIPGPAGGALPSGAPTDAPAGGAGGPDSPSADGPSASPVVLDGDEPPAEGEARELPLTEGQRQLWIESQLGDEANKAYVESASIRLRGPLDAAGLHASLRALMARHDTLRTTFAPAGDVQVVHPRMEVELPFEDLRGGNDPDEREARLDAWIRRSVRRPFDLVNGPLVRFALARVADDEHVLLFDSHHAVLDGWSSGVMLHDLRLFYEARRAGRRAELPARPDHGGLVRAQIAALREDPAARAFWMEQFADGVPVLDLPTDRPRPGARTFAGERVRRVMRGGLVRALAGSGRQHGLSMYNTLLSAFFAWLARLSGEHDVVVGTPSAGQAGRSGVSELVGYGISVLPIRARMEPAMTFVEHARRVRRTVLGALEHQNFSFPRLVEKVLKNRDTSRPPLFSVMMNLDKAPDEFAMADLRGSFRNEFGGGSKVDLNFSLVETPEELTVLCDFTTALFDVETVERWLAGFERLAWQIARDPTIRLDRLELLDDAAREAVLGEWSGTRGDYDARPIHHLVAEQAARTPAAEAIAFAGRAVTYAELDAAANRLARHLAARGAAPETVVGIVAERVPEAAVAMLAVLKAGAAYLPLDPAYPEDRLRYMLEDSGARLVVAPGAVPAGVAASDASIVDLRADAEAVAALPADAPAAAVDAESLAYVIYTSGSTGKPKGVAVTHRGVGNLAAWKRSRLGQREGDRALQFASFSFDAAVEELFGALLTGSTLVMAPRDRVMPGEPLLDTLRRERVTFATLPPAALAVMDPAGLPDLRVVVSAGDALPAAVAARWAGAVELHNAYGPSEATVAAASARVAEGDERAPAIGRPLENVRVYVLDEGGVPVPVGVPGELHVGGAGLARGYLGRPALTAGRFVPDPFSSAPGARLYRTGDRVRWREARQYESTEVRQYAAADEGSARDAAPVLSYSRTFVLEFVGRADQQVKIRGFRIEPGEVEAALHAHPGVAEAAVVVREDTPGERRLVAYVAGHAEADALRTHLRRGLPEYMVPAAFVFLDRLPLTPNGKLDAAALPAPGFEGDAAAYVEPRTPTEAAVAEILAEVLELERVGATDNFFELGGHSLLAVMVVSRVREALGVELPLNALFDGPTVEELALAVEARGGGAAGEAPASDAAAAIPPAPRDRPLPLSFEQQRLWFIQQMDPANTAYNLPMAVPLLGELDDVALERALAELAGRHEVLRTTFPLGDGGQPVQVVQPAGGFALERVSLDGVDPAEREARVRRMVRDEAGRPFDLAAQPALRARLVRFDGGHHVLLLTLHHIVCDRGSLGVLVREGPALYRAFADGRPSPLAPLPLQYADYAAWQRQRLQGPALDEELGWWKAQLAGSPDLLELPTDRPRPAAPSGRGGVEALELPAGLASQLNALAQREGCTLFMVLLAAWQALLARYSGQDDVVVGTTAANRTRREVEELVGLFMNVLALRGDLSGDPAFRELLARVRAATLGAFEHQGVPFDRVVEAVRPGRTLSHEPLVQVLFELHAGARGAAPASTEKREGDRKPARETVPARYDLTLTLYERADGISGTLLYAADLFDAATAERMLEQYRVLLESAVADPQTRVSALGMLRDAERERVVGEWNRTAAPYPHVTIHELFEEQVRRTPGAVAVVHGEETLSYAELDARANRLAHHLRRLGAAPEERVALCMERGVELMVAFFGILKSGAAYVPLDPTHPEDRLRYMLEDSGARLLLTQSWLEDRLPKELRGRKGKKRRASSAPETIFIDRIAGELENEPAERPESGVTPENLAYVYYTSGSTGRPKGVAMHHYGPANYFAWGREAYGATDGRGAPVFSSMAVDLTLANFIPLFAGERVELLPEGPGVEALAEAIRRGPAYAMIKLTPLHLSLLNSSLTPEEAARSTATLVVGADNLLAEPTLFWQEHAPGVRLLNEYGPTETVVGCSLYRLPAGRHAAGRIPIGRPISNLTMYVLDGAMQPVPAGLPGELYIGGVGVARGYLGRPALSAEKFVPDPFAPAPGARLYRTGDRARFLADGNIEFLGRVDFQVKVRGYRIETGEVESVLSAHPAVRDALVMARDDTGERQLVAYVVPAAPGAAPSADELRDALRARLPEYMLPAAFVFMDELPVGSTGKVDRRQLPAPAASDRADAAGYAAPSTPAERALAAVWEEVLRVSPVGVDDDFFALGGHSMLAVRLMSGIRRELGAELPLAALFERPTVRRLAELLDAGPAPDQASPLVAIQGGGQRVPLFFVHPIGGQVLCYVDLARELGPDQPFYGLQALDLAQVGERETTLEEMAAQYVRAIRAVRPRGPYLLGGWSFGGMVAFEMAQQLTAAGEQVPLVAILDTASPVGAKQMAAMEEPVVLAALAREEAIRAGREIQLTAAELRPLESRQRVERTLDALRRAGLLAADVEPEWVLRLLQGHRARNQAMAAYEPRPYTGRLALFRPTQALPDSEAPAEFSDPAGWQPYTAQPLRVETVQGHHATMASGPQAAELARLLRAAVDEALAD